MGTFISKTHHVSYQHLISPPYYSGVFSGPRFLYVFIKSSTRAKSGSSIFKTLPHATKAIFASFPSLGDIIIFQSSFWPVSPGSVLLSWLFKDHFAFQCA